MWMKKKLKQRAGETVIDQKKLKSKESPKSLWRSQMSELDRFMKGQAGQVGSRSAHLNPDQEIFYVINVESSRLSHSFTVETMARELKKNGEWGKPHKFSIYPSQLSSHTDGIDR